MAQAAGIACRHGQSSNCGNGSGNRPLAQPAGIAGRQLCLVGRHGQQQAIGLGTPLDPRPIGCKRHSGCIGTYTPAAAKQLDLARDAAAANADGALLMPGRAARTAGGGGVARTPRAHCYTRLGVACALAVVGACGRVWVQALVGACGCGPWWVQAVVGACVCVCVVGAGCQCGLGGVTSKQKSVWNFALRVFLKTFKVNNKTGGKR